MDSSTPTSLGTSTAAAANDASSMRFHFSSPSSSVDGINNTAAFVDGPSGSASSHGLYSHDGYDRSSFDTTGSSSMQDDAPAAASHTFDRFSGKQEQLHQVKPWSYHHDGGGGSRVGRSNSFPSMDLMPYRKEHTGDMFGNAVTTGLVFPRHHQSHPSPPSSLQRGAAMPRSSSAVDMGAYEVTHGIMNATSFPEIGNNDTQKQLRTKNIPSGVLFHSGRWSSEEHNRFVEGLHQYPHGVLNRWRKISKAVGTRTVLQTRTHAQKYFRKLQKIDDAGPHTKLLSADLMKGDDDTSGDSNENHLPNEHFDKPSVFSRSTGGVGGGSYGSPSSFHGKKEDLPGGTHLFQHRGASDAYDAAPRAVVSSITDRHANPPTCYPFPTITIPHHQHHHQQQSSSQQPTPTTEASRAFQNISLGAPRPRDELNPFQPQRHAVNHGNEQWVDWLLYNIENIPTRHNPQHQSQQVHDGRHLTRTFRSASEPVPPLTSYRSAHATGSSSSSSHHHQHEDDDPEFTSAASPSAATTWNDYAQDGDSSTPSGGGGEGGSYYDPQPQQIHQRHHHQQSPHSETKYSSLLDHEVVP
ncbi:hypothetical protein DYB25_000804 [Aphanomyces astaci]|uniref:Uncharacterized protein n=2 Tax=Aphanomyces astaci TaxID=112090 RepID=A0A397DLP6_APHAT|nr:hypothetical protein DYB36_001027 [Aphanomyces astaci]RHY22695.1 hypothetical protein DYB25_000804 [Aphanomyces astaci]RHY67517.1 hypothetical protein DYB38_003044 [Aphanomyces astaci]RHY68472.1 hypothetical protein DYB30_001040 [Aphanomyces astaci]